jgi:hypothetical protein
MNQAGRQTGRLMPEFTGIFVLLVLWEGRDRIGAHGILCMRHDYSIFGYSQ